MIARSEEEFELFQKIDIERRRADAELGDKRQPRLLEESELPDFLVQSTEDIEMQELEEEQEKEVILGRGNRARKEVTYQEQLSERDWLKAIGAEDEEGEDEQVLAAEGYVEETPKKKKSK